MLLPPLAGVPIILCNMLLQSIFSVWCIRFYIRRFRSKFRHVRLWRYCDERQVEASWTAGSGKRRADDWPVRGMHAGCFAASYPQAIEIDEMNKMASLKRRKPESLLIQAF